MTSWNFSGSAAQPTAKISLAREPEVVVLMSVVPEPQLVVSVFSIYGGVAWIVLGIIPSVHLVISTNHNRRPMRTGILWSGIEGGKLGKWGVKVRREGRK